MNHKRQLVGESTQEHSSCRAQFEAWLKEDHPGHDLKRQRKLTFRYESPETQAAWLAFMNGWLAWMAEKDTREAILEERRHVVR